MVPNWETLLCAALVATMLVLTANIEINVKLKVKLEVLMQRVERWLARLFLHKD
jgi:hypothetical protein